jgi:exopolyphosphatase/guanosine-5'-triphosphate,3'-diphosphate pyrophosphatase
MDDASSKSNPVDSDSFLSTSSGPKGAETYAALDLGSNSFHLLVAQVSEGGAHWQVLDKLKHTVRLAEGINASGRLNTAVRDRALNSLRQMAGRLRGVLPENTRVVGTRALRAASADKGFLREAEAILGVPVEVISGREEARLLYHGVIHSLPPEKKNRLVMDIGGGSTEIIVGRGAKIRGYESLHMGCVVFSRQFFSGKRSEKQRREDWQAAVTAARLTLRPHARAFAELGWRQAVGASGTFRAVAQVLAANGWGQGEITRQGLASLVERVLEMAADSLPSLPGLSASRAPVFTGGLAIVQALFESLQLETVAVASGALREGLILDLSGRSLSADIRETTVASLARRFGVDSAQVERLHGVLTALLEKGKNGGLRLKKKARQQLFWAAVLHEIGLGVAHAGYRHHGAYLVENADLPGFSRNEQARLAQLIRDHKGCLGIAAGGGEQQLSASDWSAPPVLPLLRVAVAVCRARGDDWRAFTDALLSVSWQDNRLQLVLPATWSATHPLIAADLKKTAKQLTEAAEVAKASETNDSPGQLLVRYLPI